MAGEGLDLVSAEEPSRHCAGKTGVYPMVIEAMPNTIMDNPLLIDSPVYIHRALTN
jgi:hypothetical protein